MNGELFLVFLDGNYVGACEQDFEIWDTAENSNNGVGEPLTDDNFADRVFYNRINVNRYVVDGQTIIDKFTGGTVFCYNPISAQLGCMRLNENELERERAEAKLRALAL